MFQTIDTLGFFQNLFSGIHFLEKYFVVLGFFEGANFQEKFLEI